MLHLCLQQHAQSFYRTLGVGCQPRRRPVDLQASAQLRSRASRRLRRTNQHVDDNSARFRQKPTRTEHLARSFAAERR
jgi:hypothetical protein